MYRLLEEHGEVRKRRDQLWHPAYQKPELLATRPNQVWGWDITKLRGPVKWTYFYLYVILDLFSRYVVGWMVAPRESAELAMKLIQESISKQAVPPGQLNIHADNGPSMTSKTLALKLADLGVTKSHSRPYVSDDNPFSESQFKTRKYWLAFPDRFGSLEHARAHGQGFFCWYNLQHHHSGIAMPTPHMVHYGLAAAVLDNRQRVLTAAFQRHPERFVRRPPRPALLPGAVWINPPKPGPPEGGETHQYMRADVSQALTSSAILAIHGERVASRQDLIRLAGRWRSEPAVDLQIRSTFGSVQVVRIAVPAITGVVTQ